MINLYRLRQGRGGGVGRDLGVGRPLGVVVGLGVGVVLGVVVAVGVAVAVGVGVGDGEAHGGISYAFETFEAGTLATRLQKSCVKNPVLLLPCTPATQFPPLEGRNAGLIVP